KQAQTGLEWLKKAAAQDYPPALFELSTLHLDGLKSLLRMSQEKANELLLKAANLGYALANTKLAANYLQGDGFEKNPDEAYFRASVAFALDSTDEQAAFMLGCFHYEKAVPEPSPYLACYYLNIKASKDTDGVASFFYIKSLLRLAEHLHDGNIVNGYNAMPAAFFWIRKLRDIGYEDAMGALEGLESRGQKSCANCSKRAETGEKYKHCSKCRAQWYCSKECQVEAWRAGHKQDCKRAAILNFEDYLNAE
ncbi:hypothetical protein THAOC_35572, partial [Thalassiosira oceanica]